MVLLRSKHQNSVSMAYKNSHREKTHMRILKAAMIAAFTLVSSLTVMSVGSNNAAEAKAHVTKGKPGKCGMGKFYSKKDKGCVAK
jgi:hypothetical protein